MASPREPPGREEGAAEAAPPSGDRESARWLREYLLEERRSVILMMESCHERLIEKWSESEDLAREAGGPDVVKEGMEVSTVLIAKPERLPPEGREELPAAEAEPEEKAREGGGGVDEQELMRTPDSMEVNVDDADLELDADGNPMRSDGKARPLLYRIVTGWRFEIAFAVLITMNAVVLAAERQIQGVRTREFLDGMPDEDWSTADNVFEVLEWIFGILFCVEIFLKLIVLNRDFVRVWWNSFDMVVVAIWLIDRMKLVKMGNAMVLRLMRLMRIARLLRLLQVSAVFDPLVLLIKSIRASMNVLGWSILLLNLVVAIVAMTLSELLEDWIRNVDAAPLELRMQVYESFGSFSRATETMYEVTLANWGPACRLLMNNVNEWWAVVFVLYKLCIGFAVVQVVISVFIQQTFKVAARDEDIMIREKRAAKSHYVRHLRNLFTRLDESGDGRLNREEFGHVMQDTRIREWFEVLEVDFDEVDGLFDLLDDGDGVIGQEEFLHGIKMLRGVAKQTDIKSLMNETKVNRGLLKAIQGQIVGMRLARQYGPEYDAPNGPVNVSSAWV